MSGNKINCDAAVEPIQKSQLDCTIPTTYTLPSDCWFGYLIYEKLEFDENRPQKKGTKVTLIREFALKEKHILKHLPGKSQCRYLVLDAASLIASRELLELSTTRPSHKEMKQYVEEEYYKTGKVSGYLCQTEEGHQIWISQLSFNLIYINFLSN